MCVNKKLFELFYLLAGVYGFLAIWRSASPNHHSLLTCSNILPASPGFDLVSSTALHLPL